MHQALLQGFGKAFLFALDHVSDLHLGGTEFRVGLAHQPGDRLDQPVEKRIPKADHLPMAGCASQEPSQYIAAAIVTGQDPISDQESCGPGMVCDGAK